MLIVIFPQFSHDVISIMHLQIPSNSDSIKINHFSESSRYEGEMYQTVFMLSPL